MVGKSIVHLKLIYNSLYDGSLAHSLSPSLVLACSLHYLVHITAATDDIGSPYHYGI